MFKNRNPIFMVIFMAEKLSINTLFYIRIDILLYCIFSYYNSDRFLNFVKYLHYII